MNIDGIDYVAKESDYSPNWQDGEGIAAARIDVYKKEGGIFFRKTF
jgi:hypothetical protein